MPRNGSPTRRTIVSGAVGLGLLAALLVGAAPVTAAPVTAAPVTAAPVTAAPSAGTTPTTADREPGHFPHPLDTDSSFFPLAPGTRYVYEGTVTEEGEVHHHETVFTVTDLVKRVDGVDTRVVLDVDTDDGEVAEAELALFAQDSADNVWTRAEYPEEYEGGILQGAPSTWVTGRRHARAGILVPGHPHTGTPAFEQGFAPAVGFHDVGRVTATGLDACAPTGCYHHVVKVRETAPDVPQDGAQLKLYAPGVGLVRIEARGGDRREVTTLTAVEHLGPAALAAVRDQALRLDRRGRQTNADWASTAPARRDC